jgi:DNA-binding Xre family transcriptional regulator
MFKYALTNKLNSIPQGDYKHVLAVLLKELGVSLKTLKVWCGLRTDETGDIPAGKLLIIAKFFDCEVKDLVCYEIKTKPFNYSVMPTTFLKRQKVSL